MKVKLNLNRARETLSQKNTVQKGIILLIDDEKENLDGLTSLLEKEFMVHATTSPVRAIEIAKEQEIDLVISDQRMPDMLGTDLLAELRDIQPNQVRILLTGYADIEDLIGCVNQGLLYRYIVKPWIPNDLLNTVHQAFEKLNIEQQMRLQSLALEQEVAERRQAQERLEVALKELKETQEALLVQERLRALGEMVSGVAHDFNNLLMPIHAYCEELIDDLSDEGHLKSLETDETLESLLCIRNAVTDGRALIERLRASYFPKRQSALPPLSLISVSQLLKEAIALACPRWSVRQNEELCLIPPPLNPIESPSATLHDEWTIGSSSLEVSCSVEQALSLYGDRSELRQAIVNLICNALDAMKDTQKDRKPLLSVAGFVEGDHLIIEIKDNGIGMTPEVLERCREQFFSTKGEQGTGLGLHMVGLTAEKHGGVIDLISQPNQGTQVRLRLPQK